MLRSRALQLTGALAAAVALAAGVAGCGGSGTSVLLRTRGMVLGLALQGDRLAWVSADVDGCKPHLFVRARGRTDEYPLPAAATTGLLDPCYTQAELALASENVGWVLTDQGGNTGFFVAGASSRVPAVSTVFANESYAVDPPSVGRVFGGLAGDGSRILWGWAHVSLRDTKDVGTCDLSSTDPGCETRVDRGGVFAWSRGTQTAIHGLPPVRSLFSGDGHGWLAILPTPLAPWLPGGPFYGTPRLVRLVGNRIRNQIEVPGAAAVSAFSDSMLVAAMRSGRVALYTFPRLKLIRRTTPDMWTYAPGVLSGTKRVNQPDPYHLSVIDLTTGRRRRLALADPSRETISALTANDRHVVWAVYDNDAHTSIVRETTIG